MTIVEQDQPSESRLVIVLETFVFWTCVVLDLAGAEDAAFRLYDFSCKITDGIRKS